MAVEEARAETWKRQVRRQFWGQKQEANETRREGEKVIKQAL